MRFDFAVSPNNWVEGREHQSMPKACKLIPKNSRGRENVISVSQGKLTIYLCWGGAGAKTVSIYTKGSSQTSTVGVKQSDTLIIATIFWPMGFLSSGFEKGETTYESGVMSLHQSSFTIFQSNPALILWELDLAILTVGNYSSYTVFWLFCFKFVLC